MSLWDELPDAEPLDARFCAQTSPNAKQSERVYTLNMYESNNTRGLGFEGYCNSKLVSGAQERIAITGYPGDECIIIDRFLCRPCVSAPRPWKAAYAASYL